jgi:hypothetical protein
MAIAVILAGFLAINYFTNEMGQREITDWSYAEEGVSQGTSAAQALMSEDLRALRAFEDTLSSLDLRAQTSIALRDLYRSQLERTQQLETSDLMRKTLWQQTLLNLLWGLFGAVFLIPLAMILDQRSERVRREASNQTTSVSEEPHSNLRIPAEPADDAYE